jgi:uncharacterized repeat protein (TIGR02543 family)
MEKIGLRAVFALVLCFFPYSFGFAEDSGGGGNDSPQPQVEAGNTGGKSSQQVQTPQPAKYTVTFDAGDSNIIHTEAVESGKAVKSRPADPKKEGHLFGGWFTEKDGGGTEFKADTPVTKDIPVYAKWESIGDIIDVISNELSDLKNDIEDVKKDASNDLVLLLVITGVIALFLAVFIALNIILLLTTRKKIRRLEEKTDAAEKKYNDVEQEFARNDSAIEDLSHRFLGIENSSSGSPGENAAGLKNEIVNMQNRMQEIERNLRSLNEQKIITRGITSGSLSVMDAFNLWAENPSNPPPPEAFYYIEGDMKILTKREIKESARETMWITNRNENKKYLFPNPNLFDQMTNIFDLYKMDPVKLKRRGQNKIKIITPCEMTKDGFVEFPGELELL